MEQYIDPAQEVQQRVAILRHLERLLREATILRMERDKEERANHRRSETIWTAHEALEAKMKELDEYLQPQGESGGSWPTGLHAKYTNDPSFQCYVLVSD